MYSFRVSEVKIIALKLVLFCSIEEKLCESLYAGEELQEQLIDLKNHIQLEKDKVYYLISLI